MPTTPRRADALDAAQPADDRDERRRRGDDERRVARARARDALDEEELVDAVAEHAEREQRERSSRRVGQRTALRATTMPTRTTAASDTRSAVERQRVDERRAELHDEKLTPQMSAISTSDASVSQTPGRAASRSRAWPFACRSNPWKLGKSRRAGVALSMLQDARLLRALRRRGEPLAGRKAQHPRRVRRAAGRDAAGGSSARHSSCTSRARRRRRRAHRVARWLSPSGRELWSS